MDEHINAFGHLDVGNGHQIYWEDWGNPDIAEPIVFLHGGPGGGVRPNHKVRFDPKKHRVIFHDQRGSGKSLPFASTAHNTTPDLIEDIAKLRQHLKLNRFGIVGGSWGSTLALVYAATYPKHVTSMALNGVFLGTKDELDFMFAGKIATHFPEAWERFIANVPTEHHNRVAAYCRDIMLSENIEQRNNMVKEWFLFECRMIQLDNRPEEIEAGLKPEELLALSLVEAHYFANDCFLEPDFIKKNAAKLTMPILMVHGRYDFVCTPDAAYQLSKQLPDAELEFVVAGHSLADAPAHEVFKQYIKRLFG